jgi:hypothetical protein
LNSDNFPPAVLNQLVGYDGNTWDSIQAKKAALVLIGL